MKTNKKNFDRMMIIFGKTYEKVLETDVLSIYFNSIREIPDNQTDHIIQECLKKCHYFPRPADIFEHYDEYSGEKREMRKTTKEELERSIVGIRRARQDLEKIKEPEKIGNVIRGMDILKNNVKNNSGRKGGGEI
jgi:hypothetical protein